MRWERRPPGDVARLMLHALFGGAADDAGAGRSYPLPPAGRSPGPFRLTAFQEEAGRRVEAILARHRGAVLADSVGLGKTHVALGLAVRELRAGGSVVAVVPAALKTQWRRLLRGAGEGWTLHSHTALSRGRGPAASPAPSLVVVDEAHRFRNPTTLRYAALARLTWAEPLPRVLLITATPVNNAPRDLLHLLRLFLRDDALLPAGVPSLAGAFDFDRPDGSTWVRAVVEETVVRRTRAMIADRFGPAPGQDPSRPIDPGFRPSPSPSLPRFPRRAAPRVVRYPDAALPRIVSTIAELELAPYETRKEAGAGNGAGAAALLRLHLLKRLDSSPAAFLASLGRLRLTLAAVRDAARAGRRLAPGAMDTGTGDADPLQLLLVEVLADAPPPGVDLASLADSLDRDLARVRAMGALRRRGDPKRDALLPTLSRIRAEKVVVFTEYRDTAADLWRTLHARFRTGRVDGGGAWLGARPAGRAAVVERFAPEGNGRRPPPDRERVDVLIATDVLAEGLNLQDARHVISYDLPWNPVRLLQRIGRVDRLGSPHALVIPHLFAPAEGLDAMLGLRRTLLAKLDGIATTVGDDDAEPLLSALATGAPGLASMAWTDAAGAADPAEGLRTLWIRTRDRATTGPGGPFRPGMHASEPRPDDAPAGPVPWAELDAPAGPAPPPEWIVVIREGDRARILEVQPGGEVREATGAATTAIERALAIRSREGRATPDTAGGPYGAEASPAGLGRIPEGAARFEARLRRHLVDVAADRMALPALPPSDPGRRLAHHLTTTLAWAGMTAGPPQLRRAERQLSHLARPLHPAAAARARELLAGLRQAGGEPRARPGEGAGPDDPADARATLDAVLDAIDRVLAGNPRGREDWAPAEGARSAEGSTPLAALRIVPLPPRSAVDDARR